jgi:hypothetical protein
MNRGNFEVEYDGIQLYRTCDACPQQYDAYKDFGDDEGLQQVGYLRLRHGRFRVDVPDCGGETIYTANPKGDGIFEVYEEEFYLRAACQAIDRHLRGETLADKQPDVSVIAKPKEIVVDGVRYRAV